MTTKIGYSGDVLIHGVEVGPYEGVVDNRRVPVKIGTKRPVGLEGRTECCLYGSRVVIEGILAIQSDQVISPVDGECFDMHCPGPC